MAGETEAGDLLGHATTEGDISREARDARGGIWEEAKEGEEEWVREALRQALEAALARSWAPMPQTQKATLVSLLEAKRTRNESTSIKLPPVIVEDRKEARQWSTTKTATSSTTRSPIYE